MTMKVMLAPDHRLSTTPIIEGATINEHDPITNLAYGRVTELPSLLSINPLDQITPRPRP